MRLSREKTIAGRPALQVRTFLRRLRGDSWTIQEAALLLKTTESQARRFVQSLWVSGYVEAVREQRAGTWRNTMAGNALANASFAHPVSRAEASRQLENFLKRVALVNADESWPHRVGKAVVFGSYLSDQARIGDIDLAIRLDRRPQFDGHWTEAILSRAAAAENRGRRFRGLFDRLAWAEDEIKRRLRGGQRSLSLHDWSTEEPWLQHTSHQVLLEEEPLVLAKDGNPQSPDSRVARRWPRRIRGCPF